jgi:hypothetical protein
MALNTSPSSGLSSSANVPRRQPTANPTTQILHHDPINILASYRLAVGDTAGTRSNNLLDLSKVAALDVDG